MYLGKRDFIDHSDHADPIDGIVVVDSEYLKGRKLYGQVTTTYRYGREEDEVMGVKFSKALVLAHEQLVPSEEKKTGLTPIQVMSKLFATYPFYIHAVRNNLSALVGSAEYLCRQSFISNINDGQEGIRDFYILKMRYFNSMLSFYGLPGAVDEEAGPKCIPLHVQVPPQRAQFCDAADWRR